MQNIFIDFLPPWVETGLQPAFYDKESGTVLQQVARMYAKVNELIASYNSFTENITNQQNDFEQRIDDIVDEYIEKFTALKDFVDDYFDNLDVQEEINNKLDDMVEQGTLQEIITQYIQANTAWCFDSVADMKLADNFVNGSFAQTMGYHSKNDGGNALYKVRTITNDDVVDEKFIIALNDDTLIAELIVFGKINVKQLGAYGDNTHNDTSVLKSALAKDNVEIYIPSGTYLVNETLTLLTNSCINGDGSSSILKCSSDIENDYLIQVPFTSRFCTIQNIQIEGNFNCNGIYDGIGDTPLQTRLNMINLRIFGCKTGVYLNSLGSNIDNCIIMGDYTLDNSGHGNIGINVQSTDNMIMNTRVGCFTQYGIYCYKGSNKINNVKCFLCGTGAYLRGENLSCLIEAQENFHDGIKMYRVLGSNLSINSGGAGIVEKTGDTIPTVLNNYSLIDIEECKSTVINGAFGSREEYGDTWSCEGNIIKLTKSIGLQINATSHTHTESTALPKLINADNIAGNTLNINGIKYFNSLNKQSVTLGGTSSATLVAQSGDNYDLNITASSGGVSILYFDFDFASCSNLAIFNAMNDGVKISQIKFRYTVNGTNYTIPLTSNVYQEFTSDCPMYRIIEDVSTLLSNNAQYQSFISQGETIGTKRVYIDANLSTSIITDRSKIKGLIEVYSN